MKAILHLVSQHQTIGGHVTRHIDVELGKELPHRISKRMNTAFSLGLPIVRELGSKADVIAVTISDGIRPLSNWRNMSNGLGFTGTHATHSLVTNALRSKKDNHDT